MTNCEAMIEVKLITFPIFDMLLTFQEIIDWLLDFFIKKKNPNNVLKLLNLKPSTFF